MGRTKVATGSFNSGNRSSSGTQVTTDGFNSESRSSSGTQVTTGSLNSGSRSSSWTKVATGSLNSGSRSSKFKITGSNHFKRSSRQVINLRRGKRWSEGGWKGGSNLDGGWRGGSNLDRGEGWSKDWGDRVMDVVDGGSYLDGCCVLAEVGEGWVDCGAMMGEVEEVGRGVRDVVVGELPRDCVEGGWHVIVDQVLVVGMGGEDLGDRGVDEV